MDPALTGRRVALRYDPEDLTAIDVWLDGEPAGRAVPFAIGRHVHRAVPEAARPEPAATGIDYLGLAAAAHDDEAGTGAKIDFTRPAIADYQARHLADQQARTDALLLEAIAALATLLGPARTPPPPGRPTPGHAHRVTTKTCRNVNTERRRIMRRQRGR